MSRLTFSFGGLREQFGVAARRGPTEQRSVLVTAFAGQQSKQSTLALFGFWMIVGSCLGPCLARAGGRLQACLDSRVQFRDRFLERIQLWTIVLFRFVLFGM